LAEVLAIRLRDVAFQRRLRLVLLGYPEPQLPSKVQRSLVRDDVTEALDASHVEDFLSYCLTTAGKNFDPASLPERAAELCEQARSQVAAALAAGYVVPFHEALHGALRTWHGREAW
jgi:hypothetical protein